jgi:hypothetical protein
MVTMHDFPQIRRVRQEFDHPTVTDIEGAVRQQIQRSKLRQRVRPGGRIAVAAGSRGIANLARIVGATVQTLRELDYRPFIVAAMGTHGGGTPEGQRQVLADYGITEDSMGVEICCAMDAVEIGTNDVGAPVYWDRNAFAADGVVAVNRIKAHTDFSGPIESGIIKMIVIGLGKRESPLQVHRLGGRGMAQMVPASGRVVLAKTRFALGLAILENAADQTALLQALEPEELFDAEPRLLQQSKEWMGRLPFRVAEVLIVGELGKNYSGTGIDTNVIGRRMVEGEPDFPEPKIIRLAVLDVSPESHGNAVGVGLADLTTERLVRQIDQEAFRLNTLTSRFLMRSRIPITLPTDRAVIEMCLDTCWEPELAKLRLAIIPNSLELYELYVTEPLAAELIRDGRKLEVGPPRPIPFLADGRLDQLGLFPHSCQARRMHQ